MNRGQLLYEGKAKSVYLSDTPDELIVAFRDDITAFDGQKKDSLAGKGGYNARISAFFFTYLEEKGIPTHFMGMIDDHTMAVKRLNMIPLEVIVRNRAAGSIVRRYPFREGQTFDTPLIVMDYKDDSRHDPMINDDIIIALGLLSRDEIQHVRDLALAVNRHLKELFRARGLDLVDFKIEFGRFGDTILLGDEISMDSMRLWDVKTGASLDKDVYRYDKGDVLSAYAKVVDMMIPKEFGGVQ